MKLKSHPVVIINQFFLNFTHPLTRNTIIDVCFTSESSKSCSARAYETSERVSAGPTVFAGVGNALIHIYVTQLTWKLQKMGRIIRDSKKSQTDLPCKTILSQVS